MNKLLRALLDELAPSEPPSRLSELSVQNNIDRALTFRREYYRYALGIATAMLAFSITFPPTLREAPLDIWLLIPGWGGLGLAILFGLRLHLLWAKFLITWRDLDNRGRRGEGDRARRRITRSRRVQEVLLMASLAIGIACVAWFAAVNLSQIAPKTLSASASVPAPGTEARPAASQAAADAIG